jgi:hypothetical protein
MEITLVTRTRSQLVVFRRPFVLSGLDSMQPAGTYRVDTDEEQLDTLTVVAWRRTATVIQLERGGITEHLAVDPTELHEALMRDGAQPDCGASSSQRSRSRLRYARNTMNAARIRSRHLRPTP